MSIRRLPGEPASPWEDGFGFSRVVVTDPYVRIGGTTSVDVNGVVLGATGYEQTVEIMTKLSHELERAGYGLQDAIEAHVYVTDISRAEEVGRAFAEFLGSVRPLMTMLEVSALIDPRMLVEIELVAYRE